MTTFATEQADRRLERAARLLAVGDAAAACDLAADVSRAQPDHLRARALHARCLLALHRPSEALAAIDAAHWVMQSEDQFDPRTIGATLLVLRSEALGRLGRTEQATETLEQALRANPRHPVALRRLASACLDNGSPERAIRLLKRLLARRPNHAPAWRMLAQSYEAINCPDLAAGIYEQLDQRCRTEAPNSTARRARLWRIARLHRQAQRYPEAAVALERLLELDPHDAELATEAARIAVELGEDRDVLRYCRLALTGRPDHVPARVILAEQHLRAGRFASAGYEWWRLLRRSRDHATQATAGLIVAATCAERWALADRLIAELSQTASSEDRHRHLSHLWQLATPGTLLRDVRRGAKANDHSRVLPALLADASDTLEEHLAQHPDHADRHYHLAACRRALGDSDGAAVSLDRALRINCGYVAAARQRVELLLGEANLAAAEQVVRALAETRGEEDLSWLDLSLCIEAMRGAVAEAVTRLQRVDPARRVGLAESVERLLLGYGSMSAVQAWQSLYEREVPSVDSVPAAAA
jgi:tetratricopeptide (TPR) repeat protein